MEDGGPIKPGARVWDLGDHAMRMIRLWKRRKMDVRYHCGVMGARFPGSSESTVLMRLNCPPTFDSLFVVKMHGSAKANGVHTDMEGVAMRHARERFDAAAPGRKFVPDVYDMDAREGIIVMEHVRGRRYDLARAKRWSGIQRRRFVRQMAVIRLMLMGRTGVCIGTPALSEGGRQGVGEMVGDIYFSGGRGVYYNDDKFPLGPYKWVKEYALAALKKEIIFYGGQLANGKLTAPPPGRRFETWEEWIGYLERLRNHCKRRLFRIKEPFVLSHLLPASGEHLVMRGSKIAGLLDWQKSWYMPYSEAVGGLFDGPDADREFDPREWDEGDPEPFSPRPDAEDETFSQRLERYRDAGAESEPQPNWEVIDEYGGPLCGADFAADLPSDDEGSDVHVGFEDGVSKYADSDDELEDSEPEGDDDELEEGEKEEEKDEETWYQRPVWKLMREYIMRAGEGKSKLRDELRSPLAHWRDELVAAVTSDVMTPDMWPIFHLPDEEIS